MLDEAIDALRAGKVVAAATESFFGLLADATRADAIDCLLKVKPRGNDKGQPLAVASVDQWKRLVQEVPPMADRFARSFWPGQLTIVLPVKVGAVDSRVCLDGTVAVRVAGPSVAARVIEGFGGPVTMTSANLPGEEPARTAEQVAATFADAVGRGDLRVVEGIAPGGAVSTIVALRGDRFHVVRKGSVALEDLQHVADAGM